MADLCARSTSLAHSPRRISGGIASVIAIALGFAVTSPVNAQYYNSDAGHSLRVEDATPQAFRAFSLDLFNGRVDALKGGSSRYRYEPSVDWGILPLTEIGIRFPMLLINPPKGSTVRQSTGLAGIAIGGLRAITIETSQVPALALASEVLLPVGGLSASQASFSVKALATKRFGLGRLHLNIGGGTYSLQSRTTSTVPCDPTTSTTTGTPYQGSCDDPPVIIDAPCSKYGTDDVSLQDATGSTPDVAVSAVPALLRQTSMAAPSATSLSGRTRWTAAVGFDHAFALRSASVGVDYVAEHFRGLYTQIDQTAEFGFRMQASPSTVMHGAVSWHFAGVVQSFSVGGGVTMEFAWPLVHRRSSR